MTFRALFLFLRVFQGLETQNSVLVVPSPKVGFLQPSSRNQEKLVWERNQGNHRKVTFSLIPRNRSKVGFGACFRQKLIGLGAQKSCTFRPLFSSSKKWLFIKSWTFWAYPPPPLKKVVGTILKSTIFFDFFQKKWKVDDFFGSWASKTLSTFSSRIQKTPTFLTVYPKCSRVSSWNFLTDLNILVGSYLVREKLQQVFFSLPRSAHPPLRMRNTNSMCEWRSLTKVTTASWR